MGGKQYTTNNHKTNNHKSNTQVRFPSQSHNHNHNDLADWRRTIGMNIPPEPYSLGIPAGPASTSNRTATATPTAPASAANSATDPEPTECSDSESDSASSSDDEAWRGDDDGSCTGRSDYGDDENVGSTGGSCATSTSTPSSKAHCDRAEQVPEDDKMDWNTRDDPTEPNVTPGPTASHLRLRERLHLLAQVSGEEYQTLVACNNAPIAAALAVCYDSDNEDSGTDSSIGGDSGYGADVESGADEDDDDEGDRRRRSNAPPPQSVSKSRQAVWA